MQGGTNVDESDVGPIRVGQAANFTVDAYPGVIFPGVVAQIRQAPINVQNVVTYDVVVEVSNADLKLFPGMTANVKLVTGKAEHALSLPVAALPFHPAAATPPAGASKDTSTSRQPAPPCAPAAARPPAISPATPPTPPQPAISRLHASAIWRCPSRSSPWTESSIAATS